MDEVIIAWGLLFVLLVWSTICKQCSVIDTATTKCFCNNRFRAQLMEWYSMAFWALTIGLSRTIYNFVRFDCIRFNLLQSPVIDENRRNILHEGTNETNLDDLAIPEPLRVLTLVAPIFGVLGYITVATQLFYLVRRAVKKYPPAFYESKTLHPNFSRTRLNGVIFIIGVPAMFVLMASRAQCRILSVMTGSSWIPYHREFVRTGQVSRHWSLVKKLELSTYTADLELANAVQFFSVWVFGQLCGSYLLQSQMTPILVSEQRRKKLAGKAGELHRQHMLMSMKESIQSDEIDDPFKDDEQPVDVKQALFTSKMVKWLAIQAVFAYVVIGVFRGMVDFGAAVLEERPEYKALAEMIQRKVLQASDKVFMFVTLACILNMFFVCRLESIKDKLGSQASMKFLATRLLLLFAQIQQKVITAFQTDSETLNALERNEMFAPIFKDYNLDQYRLTPEQGLLLHATLLLIECFLVAAINLITWHFLDDGQLDQLLLPDNHTELKLREQIKEAELADEAKALHTVSGSLKTPLLERMLCCTAS